MVNDKKLQNYLAQARVVAKNSPDSETKVGALLIKKDSGAVIASGYNGFIRGTCDHKLPTTRPDKYKYIVHSEQNLLYNCARHGINAEGCFVVLTLSPCKQCLRALWQSGIDLVYFIKEYRDFQEQIKMKDLKIKVTSKSFCTKLELSV